MRSKTLVAVQFLAIAVQVRGDGLWNPFVHGSYLLGGLFAWHGLDHTGPKVPFLDYATAHEIAHELSSDTPEAASEKSCKAEKSTLKKEMATLKKEHQAMKSKAESKKDCPACEAAKCPESAKCPEAGKCPEPAKCPPCDTAKKEEAKCPTCKECPVCKPPPARDPFNAFHDDVLSLLRLLSQMLTYPFECVGIKLPEFDMGRWLSNLGKACGRGVDALPLKPAITFVSAKAAPWLTDFKKRFPEWQPAFDAERIKGREPATTLLYLWMLGFGALIVLPIALWQTLSFVMRLMHFGAKKKHAKKNGASPGDDQAWMDQDQATPSSSGATTPSKPKPKSGSKPATPKRASR